MEHLKDETKYKSDSHAEYHAKAVKVSLRPSEESGKPIEKLYGKANGKLHGAVRRRGRPARSTRCVANVRKRSNCDFACHTSPRTPECFGSNSVPFLFTSAASSRRFPFAAARSVHC